MLIARLSEAVTLKRLLDGKLLVVCDVQDDG